MTNILELVRRNAKLGDPPEPYFNTFPESANVVMKRDADSKASEMSHFCWKMEASVKHQRRLHFQASCVRATQPYFHGGHLQIPLEAAHFFTPEHHSFLRGSLGLSL